MAEVAEFADLIWIRFVSKARNTPRSPEGTLLSNKVCSSQTRLLPWVAYSLKRQ